MTNNNFINILIAEDNDVSREMMTLLMRARGFNVHGAIDGESAIKVVQDHAIDLALVDINMAPKSGFEFVKYCVSKGLKIPIIVVTASDAADLLVESSSLGVAYVLQKPIDPKRLIATVERLLRKQGLNPDALAVEEHITRYTPEQLMAKTIRLAEKNAKSKRGRPFAAIVANRDGQIISDGVNGHASRVDPIAHAEVIAIRNAAEILGTDDLSGCVLYCSSLPTRIGEALLESVSIAQVYYGLSHEDTGQLSGHKQTQKPQFEQICRDEAMAMFKALSV